MKSLGRGGLEEQTLVSATKIDSQHNNQDGIVEDTATSVSVRKPSQIC